MILKALLGIVEFIIGLLPLNLPGAESSFESTLGFLKDYLDSVISFIYSYVIPYNIVHSIFTLLFVWISAKVAYWTFMWVVKKLPIGVEA